jgi:hypothetical protein
MLEHVVWKFQASETVKLQPQHFLGYEAALLGAWCQNFLTELNGLILNYQRSVGQTSPQIY